MSINLDNVTNILLGNTPVEQVTDSQGNVLWSAAPVVLPSYFYVEDVSGSDNTLSITKNDFSAPDVEVLYSTDQQNWSSMGTTSDTAITATIPANGKLYLKATADTWGENWVGNSITVSGSHNVGGNIMSLLYSDNYTNQTTFPTGSAYNFCGLFNDMNNTSHLISAQDLILPATALTDSCYCEMFNGCTSLTTAPALPATTLANECYGGMFSGCTSLTTAPALPATTLATNCYSYMFSGCTSLTTAPALPATTLANECYGSMFGDCTSLTTAPTLPATTLATNCYSYMFSGCTSLTTAPALPATTLADSCYGSMFDGCSSLTTAPILPATTLASTCYTNMFYGCTSLTTAPALPATTLYFYCYGQMFGGCTALTAAPALPATKLANQCYQAMFWGCTSLNSVTTYADNISATNCTNNWLNNVSATGDFYNLGTATYTSGASGIPTGWTVHTPSINVTIINTDSYTGATYQIDSETAQPVNVTGNTTFTVPTTATTLTVNRNGKGETSITGVSGMNTDTKSVVVIPVQDMSSNVTIEFISLM